MLQAKVVVLGDSRTGKSSLIQSLARNTSTSNSSSFVNVDVPRSELEDSSAGGVCLKFWETSGMDSKEQEAAYPGSLFTIITYDVRAPETANAAFNKWLAVRDTYMTESFLFVVGVFFDQTVHRRVDVNDMCKACAQKDAIYVEVSNVDGSNISLLWKLMIQRINFMIRVRNDLKSNMRFSIQKGEENNDRRPFDRPSRPDDGDHSKKLNTPFLERDVDADSIGSILSSSIGIEYWPGYENERSALAQVGCSLTNVVNELASLEGVPSAAGSMAHIAALVAQHQADSKMIPPAQRIQEPDFEELKHSFELMGLTLPASFLNEEGTGVDGAVNSIPLTAIPASEPAVVKIRVKLPDGSQATLKLQRGVEDVGTQVARFLDQNGMHSDTVAFEKLVNAGTRLLEEQHQEEKTREAERGVADNTPRCIVRIRLPNNQTIETTVSVSEDTQAVAARIAQEHGLSMGFQNKVWEQLRSAQSLHYSETPLSSRN
jgi:hypothetical protein